MDIEWMKFSILISSIFLTGLGVAVRFGYVVANTDKNAFYTIVTSTDKE